MKHMYMLDYEDGSALSRKIEEWISENEKIILEIVDVEYKNEAGVYFAVVTYIERDS